VTLDIKAIDPKNGDKYSPNLHAWVKRSRYGLPDVFRNHEGALYIGVKDTNTEDGEWFTGAQLNSVLCNGLRTASYAYPPNQAEKLTLVEGFWEDYTERGRCAIDPTHLVWFLGYRWTVDGDKRTCNWCGCTQIQRHWTERVERHDWFDSDDVLVAGEQS